MKIDSSRASHAGFILVEIMLVMILMAVLFPMIYGFVFREVAKESRQMAVDDESEQLLFVQNTLERLKSEASNISVEPARLVFTSSHDVTTVWLKNKQIAQDNGVLRYLTLAPVEVLGFSITAETSYRVRLSVQTRRKNCEWFL